MALNYIKEKKLHLLSLTLICGQFILILYLSNYREIILTLEASPKYDSQKHKILKRSLQCPSVCRRMRRPFSNGLLSDSSTKANDFSYLNVTENKSAIVDDLTSISHRRSFTGWNWPTRYGERAIGPPGQREIIGQRGSQGTPGFTGEPGQSGFPGGFGMPGEHGQRGSPGEHGQRGHAGEPGQRGFAGGPGIRGSPGEPGKRGFPGESGQRGSPGERGQRGSPGEPGQRGSPGELGRPGEPGEKGSPGIHGIPGQRGFSGAYGQLGQRGSPGLDGPRGVPGHPGNVGLPGPSGQYGLPGPPGQHGLPGLSGQQGLPGTYGPLGQSGQAGISGPRSLLGAKNEVWGTEDADVLNLHRGDQGNPPDLTEDDVQPEAPLELKELKVVRALQTLKLHTNPNCRNSIDRHKVSNELRESGTSSLTILVDLAQNLYCILHS